MASRRAIVKMPPLRLAMVPGEALQRVCDGFWIVKERETMHENK